MPRYDYECEGCGVVEVLHGMNDRRPTSCPQCGRGGFTKCFNATAAFHPSADSGWETFNGGLGEYMPQMGRQFLGDPRQKIRNPATHCRTRAEAIERFKRQGKTDIERS